MLFIKCKYLREKKIVLFKSIELLIYANELQKDKKKLIMLFWFFIWKRYTRQVPGLNKIDFEKSNLDQKVIQQECPIKY
jgi:hypothetical protein